MNMRLDHIQLVLFSPGIIVVDKLKTANMLNDSLSGIFDGDPIILPIPDDAPLEIPRMQLKSKDERYNLTIAKNRLDFIFRSKKDEQRAEFPVSGLFKTFIKVFQYFKEDIHSQFTRAAIVANWIIELEKTPAAEHLLSKYIRKETSISNPYELELHFLTKELVAGLKVNNWTRIKSARKISEPEQNRLITFHIDINTLAEEKYKFNQELLQEFLSESNRMMNDIIDKHLKRMEE